MPPPWPQPPGFHLGAALAVILAMLALAPARAAEPARDFTADEPTQLPAPKSAEQQPTEVPALGSAEQTKVPPLVVIDLRDAPALGPPDAPITIVEFGDFQCPYCAQGAKVLRRLRTVYPDRVRWVFKHLPMSSIHPEAALAHEAAVAAQEQGKFWEMHDLLFQNQIRLRYDDLISYARELGLDVAAFKQALDTRRYRARVRRDLNEARKQEIAGTPTYFVNGVRVVGARSFTEFRRVVESLDRPPK